MNGPILTETHKRLAARRIALDLRSMTMGKNRRDPYTWLEVAVALKIRAEPYPGSITASRGRLLQMSAKDKWIIEYNTSYCFEIQSKILAHELANWYQHNKTSEWLCDEPNVYCYDGIMALQRCDISRRVERLVVL